jgi:transcriptional regulator with XRE-family HTH domain
MEDIRLRFGKAVRKRRHKLGVSQEEFADMCGLDRTYIGGIERGERNVALVNIEKIASGLKISLSELFRDVSREIGPKH